MKNFIAIFLVIAASVISGDLLAQNISNVYSIVNGNNIQVHYMVKGLKFNECLRVSLYVSSDGGTTYQGPLKEVAGNIGENIKNGKQMIVWEAIKEIPLEQTGVIFDVRAEVISEKIIKTHFTAYAGNLVTPFGFRVGSLGRTGWYIMGQANMHPFLTGSYTYENGIITDYNKFAWYEFTSQHKISAFTACAGLTEQAGRNFFFYLGVGYGKEDYLYEIKEYSYDGDLPLGTDYARDTKISTTGIATEAGIIIRVGKVTLSGGASSISFTMPNWQVGLGLSF